MIFRLIELIHWPPEAGDLLAAVAAAATTNKVCVLFTSELSELFVCVNEESGSRLIEKATHKHHAAVAMGAQRPIDSFPRFVFFSTRSTFVRPVLIGQSSINQHWLLTSFVWLSAQKLAPLNSKTSL